MAAIVDEGAADWVGPPEPQQAAIAPACDIAGAVDTLSVP